VKCCVSPNGHYLAIEWRSTFTFRRQPTERPDAATIQLISGKTGQALWEKPRPGKLLGVNEGGEVLCFAEAGKAVAGKLLILADSGEPVRRVTPPGRPAEAVGIGPGFFLVQCLTDEEPDGFVLATKAGSFREIPVTEFTSAASLREGIVAVGSLSGTVTGFDSQGKKRWEAGMGGPVTVRSLRDGTFLAATTSTIARFDKQAKELWQVSLADLVAVRESAKRPAGKEIVSTTVDADRRRLGLAPTESARLVEEGDDPRARQFSVLLKRDTVHQVLLTWQGELRGSVRIDGDKPVEWIWPSASSRHQVGAFILPPTSAGNANVSVTATRLHQVEVRDWKLAGQNLGRASQPTLTEGMESPIDDLRLWVFNPPYYAQMMGTRPKQAAQKWIPAAIAPRALADGNMPDRVMAKDRAPWWYEIRFRSPRTVSSLLAIEDLSASSSWATEGFVSARAAKSEECKVLARFRGRSAGRALSWAPAKVSGIRFHVTKGGNACTEAMVFGTEDSADLEEME
jgi:hypothetical protein